MEEGGGGGGGASRSFPDSEDAFVMPILLLSMSILPSLPCSRVAVDVVVKRDGNMSKLVSKLASESRGVVVE